MFSSLFGFRGRIGRGGWWFGQFIGLAIIGVLVAMALALHDPNRTDASNNDFLSLMIFAVSLLAIMIVNICSTVKRYHDRGKSGWWYFVSVIPVIGGIWQLIECGFCSGDDGDNHYGPPPGAAHRMENLEREMSAMGGGKLSKVDDDYLANYAQKLASVEMQHHTSTNNTGQTASGRAVFGKR
jgi:uncharacterized membrane protein YhaH (DUF805 family)